jgi:RNA-directed DNA polymerase
VVLTLPQELRALVRSHQKDLYDILLRAAAQSLMELALLANLLLDERDKELERRGHRFARAADDANILVRSQQAGARVMARVTRYLERKRRRKVNAAQSAVDRPWHRTVLGVTCTRRQPNRRQEREKALKAFQAQVRAITGRPRSRTIRQIVPALRQLMLGWRAFVGVAEVRSPFRDLDTWGRRRLRSYHWKQWGRKRYRELRKRGVDRQLAWNTVTSAHGPWRPSQSPALAIALPQRSSTRSDASAWPRRIASTRRTAGDVTRTSGDGGGGRP